MVSNSWFIGPAVRAASTGTLKTLEGLEYWRLCRRVRSFQQISASFIRKVVSSDDRIDDGVPVNGAKVSKEHEQVSFRALLGLQMLQNFTLAPGIFSFDKVVAMVTGPGKGRCPNRRSSGLCLFSQRVGGDPERDISRVVGSDMEHLWPINKLRVKHIALKLGRREHIPHHAK